MPTLPRLVIAVAIVVQVSATAASADPVRVTGGSLSFDTGDPPAFSLLTSTGQLLEAEGFRLDWPATCFFQCSPGVTIPIALVATEADDPAFFRADGVDLFPVMRLGISGTPVTLGSDIGTRNGPFEVFQRPFTFAGQLTGYATPDRIGPPVFDVTLTGSGTARLSMALEEGRYSFSSLDYNFEAVAPVPEPATLLLVGAGAGLIWRRRQTHR